MNQPTNSTSRLPAGSNTEPKYRTAALCGTKMPVREYCPITGNKPMICTRAGFAASCEKFQELDRKKRAGNCPAGGGDHLTKYCTICNGDFLPENVTFIDVDRSVAINQTKKKERKMPKTVFNPGTCESCGGVKKVSGHYGKQVCYSCLAFRISAKNIPHLVIGALKEFGHMPSVPVPGPADESVLCGDCQEMSDKNAELRLQLDIATQNNADQQQKIHNLEERLFTVCDELESYKSEIGDLNIVVETLKSSIRVYQSEEDARLPEQSMSWPQSGLTPDTDVVEQIAWTLAEGTIAGTITGVSLDDIRRLRSLV